MPSPGRKKLIVVLAVLAALGLIVGPELVLATLLAHPDDLAARGLADGQTVCVRSASGEVEVEVAATDDVMPGVVSLPHGYGHARPGVRLRNAQSLPGVSINDLTDPSVIEGVSGNAVLNGVPVTLESARGDTGRGAGTTEGREALAARTGGPR